MNRLEKCGLRVLDSVRRDVQAFRATVQQYLEGKLDATRFKVKRVPMGIYEQRRGGFMVRVRIGAGVALPGQLRALAKIAADHGAAHLTTRQDVQLHDVPVEAIPGIFEQLLAVNLTGRGGGGNTVRNVSASPRAGVDPAEVFDVRPHAIATAEYLLDSPGAFNLPRKYKLAFSGTAADDAFASVADLGFFAREQDGQPGFRVFAGGGLGGSPKPAIVLEEWVPAEDAPLVAEALRRLFDRRGDRGNKHAARLRFVVEKMGEQEFRDEYFRDKAKVAAEHPIFPAPRPFPSPWRPELAKQARELRPGELSPLIEPERRVGFYTVRINPRLGLVNPEAMLRIADLAEANGEGLVRFTQRQEGLLCGIPGGLVGETVASLRKLGKDIFDERRPSVVACAGAATCQLGLCLSRGLATAIEDRFTARADGLLPAIRISGCPNSCGNHQVAKLGLAGKARRVQGRLIPYYDVMVDGRLGAEGARLAQRIGSLPAKRVFDFLERAATDGEAGFSCQNLHALIDEYQTLPETVPEDWFRDWGSDQPFSLAGRGPGECGAGTFDLVRVDIETAKGGLAAARAAELPPPRRDQALAEAAVAIMRALLPVFGLEPGTRREVYRDFQARLVDPGWVDASGAELAAALQDWQAGDRQSLAELEPALTALIERVEELFASLDASLRFQIKPLIRQPETAAAASASKDAATATHDLRGVACPLNFVRAKVALESRPVGSELEFLLDPGAPANNVPASFAEQGQQVLSMAAEDGWHRLRVRRVK